MGALSFNASYQYALGLCGVFVGVFLFVSAVNHLVIKPIAWKKSLDRRLARKRRDQLAQVQILRNTAEQEKGLLVSVMKQFAGLGKIENLQRSLLQADIFLQSGHVSDHSRHPGLRGLCRGISGQKSSGDGQDIQNLVKS